MENKNSIDTLVYPSFENYYIVDIEPNEYLGLPILYYLDTALDNVQIIDQLLRESYASQSVKLYYLVQNYLKNTHQIDKIESAYVKLSGSEEGETNKGFYLRKEKEKYLKDKVYYINYRKDNLNEENFLGSFAHVFPHEMGHVLISLLTNKYENSLPKSINHHFSSIITDFRTAFTEGFAIHFENIARNNDPNSDRIVQMLDDANLKKQKIDRILEGYLRDFYMPFRLDYYRLTPFIWYHQFELIKRMEWVKRNYFKYNIHPANFRNEEKALFYRNSGISPDSSALLNYQQAISNEGVIASFFEKLIESKLQNNYLNYEYYKEFLNNPPEELIPELIFTPLENQYIKVFKVMNKCLDSISINQSPFIKFIDGYLQDFPEEKGVVLRIFEDVTGYYYTNNSGPEIWLLNKQHKHGFHLFDQFGGNKTDYYTFNLNVANKEDILTFKNIKRSEADSILNYRKQIGFFSSLKGVDSVPGLSDDTKSLLKTSAYNQEYVDQKKPIVFSNVKMYLAIFMRLIEKGLFYLLLFITFYYLLFYGKNHVLRLLTVKYVIRKVAKLFLLIFFGFAAVLFSYEPLNTFLIISVIFISLELLFRKRERNRKDAFYTSFFIIVMIMFSVW